MDGIDLASRAGLSSSIVSSGSRPSTSAVEPTMSARSTVTNFSSPSLPLPERRTWSGRCRGGRSPGDRSSSSLAALPSDEPHAPQIFAPRQRARRRRCNWHRIPCRTRCKNARDRPVTNCNAGNSLWTPHKSAWCRRLPPERPRTRQRGYSTACPCNVAKRTIHPESAGWIAPPATVPSDRIPL